MCSTAVRCKRSGGRCWVFCCGPKTCTFSCFEEHFVCSTPVRDFCNQGRSCLHLTAPESLSFLWATFSSQLPPSLPVFAHTNIGIEGAHTDSIGTCSETNKPCQKENIWNTVQMNQAPFFYVSGFFMILDKFRVPGRRDAPLPLSIPTPSTVHTPPLNTLLWRGASASGRRPTHLRRPLGCHGNSRSASSCPCRSWHCTVEQSRRVLNMKNVKSKHMELRSNLSPRTKTPLSLVALVGENFGPRGNRMAAGTLGQFTVLRRGRHTQPFMQRLTK